MGTGYGIVTGDDVRFLGFSLSVFHLIMSFSASDSPSAGDGDTMTRR